MLTPEEERKVEMYYKIVSNKENPRRLTKKDIVWVIRKLKEAHDQNVQDVDRIIVLEQVHHDLSEELRIIDERDIQLDKSNDYLTKELTDLKEKHDGLDKMLAKCLEQRITLKRKLDSLL